MRGLTFAGNHTLAADTIFVSTGDDKKVCIWSLGGLKKQLKEHLNEHGNATILKNYVPKATYVSKSMVLNCDHSYAD